MPRLPQGMRQKGDRYETRFSIDGHRKSVYGKTVRECQQKKKEMLDRASEGLKICVSDLAFADYAEQWLNTVSLTVKPSTAFSYKKKLKPIISIIGKKNVVDLDRQDILTMQRKLSEKYSTASVNYAVTLTRNIMNHAVADRIVNHNPVTVVKALKRVETPARDTIHRAMTKEEQAAFLKASEDSWYRELFRFMLLTGVRAGEAGALTWGDIDLKNGVIHINKTVTRIGFREWGISTTKTAAGTRDIPLTKPMECTLKEQRQRLLDYKGIEYLHADRCIFIPFSSDELLKNTTITHAIDSVRLHMDPVPEHFSSHALRDTFATRAAEQGMDMNTLKTILGHTKISVTMDLYAHVLPDTKKDAMKAINIF